MERPTSIAPLVTFRVAFGLITLFSTIRYVGLGWVDDQLVDPILHFSYFGFDWVEPLPRIGMYCVFALMMMASIGIVLGWYYRFFVVTFFLCFTYVELIDITYYLNHYYFVSLIAFLLIWLPAHRSFSLDMIRRPSMKLTTVPSWCVDVLKLQIAIVYIYAGLAKINGDWLQHALPLSIWLPAKTGVPFIGFLFSIDWIPMAFSWMGMLFDTCIIFGLLYKHTRVLAYIAVVLFHTMTGMLFQIGVFPIVMIMVVTIFFSDSWHLKWQNALQSMFRGLKKSGVKVNKSSLSVHKVLVYPFLALFFLFQLLFPWRYLLYPGNLFWTEEGYRFSWRVMLMEKAGTATFYVRDGEEGREGSVVNHEFLNAHQEKQMAMQPDLILQFAKYLAKHYRSMGMEDPRVRAVAWVTLNARPAQLLIDPEVNLVSKRDTWAHKDWILPYQKPLVR